jgi:hypothetical protein
MVIRNNVDMESESNRSDCEYMPPLEDYTGEEIAYLIEGEALVIRRTFWIQVKKDDID